MPVLDLWPVHGHGIRHGWLLSSQSSLLPPNALYELNWDRPRPKFSFGVKFNPNAPKLPKLAVLYIHGWKHNADAADSDLQHFTELIQTLRETHAGKRYVVGIYVGWNADAPLWGPLENTTFWVKKNNVDHIAQSANVTFIFSAIGSIIKADPRQQDQFIAIGHSFGRASYSQLRPSRW
ncbi:hypothetical protein AB7M43_000468 [Bradyrhizobium elkanii]